MPYGEERRGAGTRLRKEETSTRYYLGIDNGGTSTKAALFSSDGTEIGVASVSTSVIQPRPDFAERDMEEMWRANCEVVAEVIRKTGVANGDIAGMAICGHGKGLYPWGKDGKPARNGIMSTDNRAYEYVNRWREDGTERDVFKRSCQHVLACQPVSLLAWLRDNEREVYDNIRWVFSCKDYVRFRFTGAAMAELTDCSGTNLINLRTRGYDDNLLRLFGICDIRMVLPALCMSGDICGYVTDEAAAQCGLKPGTPVLGGMFDIDACAVATGVLDESRLCMIAGTWSINEYLSKQPVTDGRVLMNSLFCLPEYYLIEESSATSAGNSEWFIQNLLPEVAKQARIDGKTLYDELSGWVESVPPEAFVPVFLPFLHASNVHPNAKACFLGVCANHTRKHLLRSVYEGVAFSHRYHLDKLIATRGAPPVSVRLAGGAARNRVWAQMFADIIDLPVETVNASETGALGCAIITAASLGEYPTIVDACEHMISVSPPIMPDPSKTEVYRRKYALYMRAIESLDALWPYMQRVIETDDESEPFGVGGSSL